jgi:hypothetical protein
LRQYDAHERTLQQKLDTLIQQKKNEDIVHQDTVEFLKHKEHELKAEVHEWLTKKEERVHEMTEELTDATTARETDLDHLNRLKARREKDIADELARLAELAHQQELEKLRLAEERRRKIAAIKIQKCYRAYKQKKEAAKAAKGGKKGGKKGKKK